MLKDDDFKKIHEQLLGHKLQPARMLIPEIMWKDFAWDEISAEISAIIEGGDE